MGQLRLLTAILLTAFCLQFCGEFAESAQTINGKAIGSVDDVVKEVNRGDLSLPKKRLITLRGGDFRDNSYASVFGADASASNARKFFTTYPTSDPAVSKTKEIHAY